VQVAIDRQRELYRQRDARLDVYVTRCRSINNPTASYELQRLFDSSERVAYYCCVWNIATIASSDRRPIHTHTHVKFVSRRQRAFAWLRAYKFTIRKWLSLRNVYEKLCSDVACYVSN